MVDSSFLLVAWFVIYLGAVSTIPDFSSWANRNPGLFVCGLFGGSVLIGVISS
jgi:hypothetical protein